MAELTAFLSSPAPWAVLTGAGVIALAAMFRPVAFVVTLRRAGGVRALHDALVIEATSAAGTALRSPLPGSCPRQGSAGTTASSPRPPRARHLRGGTTPAPGGCCGKAASSPPWMPR